MRIKRKPTRLGGWAKHGMCKSRIYASWRSMKSRCSPNPNSKYFDGYYCRGIRVCGRWETFENFLEDMAPRPAGMVLDRVNNDSGYSKENCRWARPKVSSNNRRITKKLEFQGVCFPLKYWSAFTGIRYQKLYRRIYWYHWNTEKALTTP